MGLETVMTDASGGIMEFVLVLREINRGTEKNIIRKRKNLLRISHEPLPANQSRAQRNSNEE